MPESRTSKSIRNVSVMLIYFGVSLVLQFISRKVFLEQLGTEVLGLNTTANNLLQFLNLAELGIGSAIAFSLYKPFQNGDRQAIREIVAVQGYLYRRIAGVVIVAAVIVSCFFPWIFSKMELPLWYAYATFGVLLFSSMLTYFANYKEILLQADQKEYKIVLSYGIFYRLKLVAQIAAMVCLSNPYVWWLALEAGFAIIASAALSRAINRTYPFIREKITNVRSLIQKYPDIVTKTKQLFIHRISCYVLQQTSPLIIYACISMTMVALYGNYMLIVGGFTFLMMSMFNSVQAGVGNLVAEGRKDYIMQVFGELFAIRFYMCTLAFTALLILSPPFVSLWIGETYLLPTRTTLLIAIIFFITTMRAVVDSFVSAHGLFGDVWAPIAESILNIGLSIAFGIIRGLDGILFGVICSLVVIVVLWRPFYLFRFGMREPFGRYVSICLRCLAAVIPAAVGVWLVVENINLNPSDNILNFMAYSAIVCITCAIALLAAMWFITPEIRLFAKRITSLTKK